MEMQQKRSLIIILGGDYGSYSQAKSLTCLADIGALREEACFKCAQRSQIQNIRTYSQETPVL